MLRFLYTLLLVSLSSLAWSANPSSTPSFSPIVDWKISEHIPIARSSVVIGCDTGDHQECNMGNLLSDAVLNMANQQSQVDITLLPHDLFYSPIIPNAQKLITLGQIRNAVANTPLSIVQMTSAKLIHLIEMALLDSDHADQSTAFLQIAGFHFAFDPHRPPLHQLITLVLDSGLTIVRDGILLNPDQTIKAVVPDSWASSNNLDVLFLLPFKTQTALAHFLLSQRIPWYERDTDPTDDLRIRNLSLRNDGFSNQNRSPLTGWYWQEGHYGTSLALEEKNGRLMIAWFVYDNNGSPIVYRATLGRLGTGFDGSLCLDGSVVGRIQIDLKTPPGHLTMKINLPGLTTSLSMTSYTDSIYSGWTDRRDINGWWYSEQGDFFLETRGGTIIGAWLPKNKAWQACAGTSTDNNGDLSEIRMLDFGLYANGPIVGGTYKPAELIGSSSGWSKIADSNHLELNFLNETIVLQKNPYVLNFAILSDPHLLAPKLIHSYGPALRFYEFKESKLLAASDAIMKATIDHLIQDETLALVIIPGDLTKDGEAASHQRMVTHLERLKEAGIATFVVPGNHDILNPDAMEYWRNATQQTTTITPEEFATYYAPFGYAQALSKDKASLSYVVEPMDGIWLFAIDSCRYDENTKLGYPVVGGRIRTQTKEWLIEQAALGRARGKILFAFMHHGLMEHFRGQASSALTSDYVLEDWEKMASLFADAGIQLIFTGHAHTMDVTKLKTDLGNTIYDVETTSLIASTGLFRRATLDSLGNLLLTTDRIKNIDYDLGEKPFYDYGANFFSANLELIIPIMLVDFGLPLFKIKELSPSLLAAISAHHYGDETPTIQTWQTILNYIRDPNETISTIGLILATLWSDLEPHDNNLIIQTSSPAP